MTITARIILLLTIPLLAFILWKGPLPPSSGDIRALFPYHSATLDGLAQLERRFGDSLFDSIVIRVEPELSIELEEQLTALGDELSQIPNIISVVSPLEGYSKYGLPIRVLNTPRTFGRFLIEVDGTADDAARRETDLSIEAILSRYPLLQPIRAGAFVATESATMAVERESKIWTPVCLGILVLLTYLIFGDLRTTAQILAAPFLALLWIIAGVLFFKLSLSPVSQLVPPLLLALGASYSVYTGTRYLHATYTADGKALAGLRASIALAAATSIAGFLSLLTMNTRAVAQFGILMTCGSALAALFSLVLTPALLNARGERLAKIERRLRFYFVSLRPLIGRRYVWPFVATSLLLAVWIPDIHVDTSPLDFLPKESAIRGQLERAQAVFPGTHPLSLSFERTDGAALTADDIALISDVQSDARQLSEVHFATSIADFISLNERIEANGQSTVDLSVSGNNRFGPLSITSADNKATRILVESDAEGRELLTLRDKLMTIIARRLHSAVDLTLRATITSRELIMAEQSTTLAKGLLLSVVTALFLVGALLTLVFRDLRMGLVGLIPSLLPIAVIFGLFGLLYDHVNLGAAMVAAVALGTISDNTFHFLISYRESTKALPESEAIFRALSLLTGACLTTGIVMIGGFSPTDFSALAPMREFGIFLGLSLVLGLYSNLIVLPYMMQRFYGNAARATRDLGIKRD